MIALVKSIAAEALTEDERSCSLGVAASSVELTFGTGSDRAGILIPIPISIVTGEPPTPDEIAGLVSDLEQMIADHNG